MRYQCVKNSLIKLVVLFFTIMFSYEIVALDFNNKSLICSTKKFPVKGGFHFINKIELVKYNILYDVSIKSEYLHNCSTVSKLSDHNPLIKKCIL